MTMPRTLSISTLVLCLGLAVTAKATEKPTQYLGLANAGAYVIKPVKLHWKTPTGKKYTHTYNTEITNGGMFCLDLKKFELIEEGSEVWLTANIVLGGSSNCRKSNPRVYKPNGKVQFYKMAGETRTNNRCKLVGSVERTSADKYQGGNSEVCMNRPPVKIAGESQAEVSLE